MNFELFYSDGGHGGPYKSVDAARERAEKYLRGGKALWVAIVPYDKMTDFDPKRPQATAKTMVHRKDIENGKKASLRGRVIRIAFENPDLRGHLLPLLKEGSSKPKFNWKSKGGGDVHIAEVKVTFDGQYRPVKDETVQFRVDARDLSEIRADKSTLFGWEAIDDRKFFGTVEDAKQWAEMYANEIIRQQTFSPKMPRRSSISGPTIYDYRTGEVLRRATKQEYRQYLKSIVDDHTGTGAVDGRPYGFRQTVYMQD